MRSLRVKKERLAYTVTGALIGAFAPLLFTYLLVRLYSHTAFSGYAERLIADLSSGFIPHALFGSSTLLMAGAGALVGRVRERDALMRASLEAKNRELSALNTIADILANTKCLDDALRLVLSETLSLGFLSIQKKGVIFVQDAEEPGLLRMAAEVEIGDYLRENEKLIEAGWCLCGKAFKSGEVIVSTDCFKDPDHTMRYPGMAAHGHVMVPIAGNNGVSGVMTFYLPPNVRPTDDDIRLLTSIASQLAVAIDNARLVERVVAAKESIQRKNAELAENLDVMRTLVELDLIILSTFDRDELIGRVTSKIRQIVDSDVGGVALRDPKDGSYYFAGGWGMEKRRGILSLPTERAGGKGLMKIGAPTLRDDLGERDVSSPIDRLLLDAGVRSNIIVPIIRNGRATGIFFLGSHDESGLDKEKLATAAMLASRIGISLEHSRLIHGLENMSVNVIHALATAIDAKSPWTKGHSERVAHYSLAVAEEMGFNRHLMERLKLAGLLHDIGKIGTYDILLDKPDKLTLEEMELVKRHPDKGCEILNPIKELKDILPAVRHHHERWDGRGYPAGLRGEEIPMMARILCVADSFDTMTADRPYRPSIGLDNAVRELRYCAGLHFDPEVVEVFLDIIAKRGTDVRAWNGLKNADGGSLSGR